MQLLSLNGTKLFNLFIGVLFLILLSSVDRSYGQERGEPLEATQVAPYSTHNKGKFYIYWGWNRGSYSKSNIHFRGDDYDFTIRQAKAHDRQAKFNYHNYFQPDRITIPQTNVRAGYFLSDHFNISLGIDHMKYIMTEDQMASVFGYIDIKEGNPYNGNYDGEKVHVTDDLLHFEHTDGLNYVNIQLERYDDLGRLLGGNWDMDKLQINLYEGIGVGVLVPKTNATILNRPRHDKFHLSGLGISLHQGLNLTVFKHYFVRYDLKEGMINMRDIRTTHSKSDRASQHFFFFERTLSFGGIFKL